MTGAVNAAMSSAGRQELPKTGWHSPAAGFFTLILVNFMWAFQFSGAKLATARLGPITVAFLPLAISTTLLAPFVSIGRTLSTTRKEQQKSPWTIMGQFVLLGTMGVIPAQLFLVWGVARSLASNAAVLNLAIPALTAVLASLILREKMTVLRWEAFLLAIGGVLLVSDIDWRSLDFVHSRYLAGNILIFGSCFGSAFNNTFSKRLLQQFSPVEVLVYSFAVSSALLLPLMLIWEPISWARIAGLGWDVWVSLILIAVFSLGASTMLYLWVIERMDVTTAAVSIYLLPVFGVLFSFITLGERITARLLVGAVLVFASTFLVTIYEERQNRRTSRPELRRA
jgi:drug/metabolite transporter (DMT)-like permease